MRSRHSHLEEAVKGGWIGRIGYWNASTGLHQPKGLDVKGHTA